MASTPPALDVRRHDIVHLTASCAVHASDLSASDAKHVRDWIAAARPFVVRQQSADAVAHNRICLGLPLPPSTGKRRIAIEVDSAQVSRIAPPPLLRECLHAIPAGSRDVLMGLERSAREVGIVFRVFGSIAFQALTRLEYLHRTSDVDLLWNAADHRTLEAGLALLAAWESSSGMRADGEILFAQHAVSWREWLKGNTRVLVKGLHRSSLVGRDELVALLDGEFAESDAA